MLVAELFEEFLEQIKGQSNDSLRNYRNRLRFFIRDYGHLRPEEITVADVNQWHRTMLDLGHAEATNAGYRQAIKSLFNWFIEGGLISVSPARHLVTGSFLPEHVLIPNEDDVQTVCAWAFKLVDSDNYVDVRRAAVWFYAYETMCRLGGIIALQFAEIQKALKKGPNEYGAYRVRSREKVGKVWHEFSNVTAYALERCILLRPSTNAKSFFVLTKYSSRKGDVEPVATLRGVGKSTVQKDFVTICLDAGVDPIRCHSLRHRGGDLLTRLYGAKVASKKLNHTNIKTTLLYYHKADQDDVSKVTFAQRPQREPIDTAALIADFFGKTGP